MEKNLNIPKRIITRRNTTCSVNANLRSRAASYDTEVEQQQQRERHLRILNKENMNYCKYKLKMKNPKNMFLI